MNDDNQWTTARRTDISINTEHDGFLGSGNYRAASRMAKTNKKRDRKRKRMPLE